VTETRDETNEDNETPGEGLVISDTSEFVRSLTVAPTITKPVEAELKPDQQPKAEPVEEDKEEGEADDVEMGEVTEEKKGGWKEAGNIEDSDMAHIQDEPKLVSHVY
jgi:hypothetical protein